MNIISHDFVNLGQDSNFGVNSFFHTEKDTYANYNNFMFYEETYENINRKTIMFIWYCSVALTQVDLCIRIPSRSNTVRRLYHLDTIGRRSRNAVTVETRIRSVRLRRIKNTRRIRLRITSTDKKKHAYKAKIIIN